MRPRGGLARPGSPRRSIFPNLAGGRAQPGTQSRTGPMLIGVPKEVKTHEYRVGLVPGTVREVVHHGHHVVVESGLGEGIGFIDADYERAGAKVARSAAEVFGSADMIVKVKEPQPKEIALLRSGQVLFTYLHL